jgi:hypothetical protein
MTNCRARAGREEDGLRVWEPIESSLRRESERYVVRCEDEKKNRGSKPRRRDYRRKDCKEGGEGKRGAAGGEQLARSPYAKPHSAASRPFPLLSHCGRLTIQLYMVHVHRCPAAQSKTANNARLQCPWPTRVHRIQHTRLMYNIYSAFPASSPRGWWRCASARQSSRVCLDKKSGRVLDVQYTVPRGHGHVGERGMPRAPGEIACSRFKSPEGTP